MRHIFGLLVGIVVAVAVLFGGGWAAQQAMTGAAQNVDPVKDGRMLLALGVMIVVGLLIGLVLVGRLSPLAAFVPSMVLLAWTVVYALDVTRAADLAPTGDSVQKDLAQAGEGMQVLLFSGVYGLLGVALFIPVLMPSRWAGPPREDVDDYDESQGQDYY